jgi:hypothetical protein
MSDGKKPRVGKMEGKISIESLFLIFQGEAVLRFELRASCRYVTN